MGGEHDLNHLQQLQYYAEPPVLKTTAMLREEMDERRRAAATRLAEVVIENEMADPDSPLWDLSEAELAKERKRLISDYICNSVGFVRW